MTQESLKEEGPLPWSMKDLKTNRYWRLRAKYVANDEVITGLRT